MSSFDALADGNDAGARLRAGAWVETSLKAILAQGQEARAVEIGGGPCRLGVGDVHGFRGRPAVNRRRPRKSSAS